MNNFMNIKREREKKITRLQLILFFLVVITAIVVIVIVNNNGDKKVEKYKKLEKDLTTATIYYYGNKANKIEKGGFKIITMDEIVKKGYLQGDITKECKGYTAILNIKNLDGDYEINYYSYIKCGKTYMTENFNEEDYNLKE